MEKPNGRIDDGFSSYAGYLASLERSTYRCSFCKKEFRSAQALGGHMNVHRRDRAKKRSSPSSSQESLPTNPNPYLISSSSSSATPLLPISQHPVMKRREVGVNLNKRALVDLYLPANLSKRAEVSLVRMKNEAVNLDLSLGVAKDDLDLELRLGRS